MAKILIKGGRVISPAQDLDDTCDVLIDKGRVAAIGKSLDGKGAEVIDVLLVCSYRDFNVLKFG